jgi:peptidoglycan L-alanyl-D-glutamate endopeptidase CwlK
MSREISDLDADVQDMAVELLKRANDKHIVLIVTQTRRTYAEQTEIWEQGRSSAGAIVTHAPAGYSWHNFGRAFDVAIKSYPFDLTPKNLYDGPWEEVGAMGEAVGLEWGGRWKHPDKPHFEHHGGSTLAQARERHDQPNLA